MKSRGAKQHTFWIQGVSGKMGQEILAAAEGSGPVRIWSFAGGSAQNNSQAPRALFASDILFDFSTPDGNQTLLNWLRSAGDAPRAVLIGTTGLSEKQIQSWRQLAKSLKMRVLLAPNTSLGILILRKILNQVAGTLISNDFDVEIVETHHRRKKDAPSGTARSLFDALAKNAGKTLRAVSRRDSARESSEVGMHSVRGGGVFGEHSVRFIGESEEVTFSHRAFSRALFARGALWLGHWLLQQKTGFYGLDDVSL